MWGLIPLSTALLGMSRANRQADAQKKQNLAQSEQTRYSFATGGPQGEINTSYVPSGLEGGIAGGIQGLGIAQGLGLGGMGEPSSPDVAPAGGQYANILGAKDMANRLGQMTPSWSSVPMSFDRPSYLASR